MKNIDIVKDVEFEEVAEVKVDSKNRVTLGKKSGARRTTVAHYYRVYRNAIGQIILDPQATVPAHEQWLFKNREAAQMVRAGLKDAKKGRLVNPREDFSKYAKD